MDSSKYVVYGVVAVCALALTGEVFAAGEREVASAGREGGCPGPRAW